MTFLGVDYGTKRVGLAVSDNAGRLAFPLGVFSNGKDLISSVLRVARERAAGAVVVGESKDFSMADNPLMGQIRRFKGELEAAGLAVYLEPEFLTTAQAKRLRGDHDKIDASAAALILQGFLDKSNMTPIPES